MKYEPTILFEDNHYIAISKPAGIPVQGEYEKEDSVMNRIEGFIRIRDKKPGKAFIGMMHRLDKPVTGVLVLAKTSKGQERFNELLRDKKIEKLYLALVDKKKVAMSGTLEHYFHRHEDDFKVSVSEKPQTPKDQKAILHYTWLGSIDGRQLMVIELVTGRRHQIRAQLAHIGMPIIGDKRYGSKEKNDQILLHCVSMCFVHPIKKTKIKLIDIPRQSMDWDPFFNLIKKWTLGIK